MSFFFAVSWSTLLSTVGIEGGFAAGQILIKYSEFRKFAKFVDMDTIVAGGQTIDATSHMYWSISSLVEADNTADFYVMTFQVTSGFQ